MNVTTEQLFTEARTQNGYLAQPVSDDTLRAAVRPAEVGPHRGQQLPGAVCLRAQRRGQGKAAGLHGPGNVAKVQQAPVTVIIGMDLEFHDQLPQLFPHTDARAWFAGKPAMIEASALRNSSLQGGYLILAARALGLDCGPMSGFDAAKVDAAFWAGTRCAPTSSARWARATRPS
jgi:3-hydroxypropanoate dehydrogenase